MTMLNLPGVPTVPNNGGPVLDMSSAMRLMVLGFSFVK